MEQNTKVKGGKINYDNCDNLLSITRDFTPIESAGIVPKNVFASEWVVAKGLNIITNGKQQKINNEKL
jgi:hypothetical protein